MNKLKQLFFSISVNSGFRNIYLAAPRHGTTKVWEKIDIIIHNLPFSILILTLLHYEEVRFSPIHRLFIKILAFLFFFFSKMSQARKIRIKKINK